MSTYIKGTYSKSIYESSTGYYVGICKVSDTNEEDLKEFIGRTITFTGYFHELNNVDTYLFHGKLVNHEKYGKQFQVESYERCKPEEKDSIIEFLTSGLFKGIGEKSEVARYHSLAAVKETIPDELKITALSDDDEVMAIEHRDHRVYGLQFHPESILTSDGKTIIKNFLQIR